MLQNRKEEMRTLASALRKELKHFEHLGVNKDLDPEIFRPLRTRLNGTPLRAYFSQKMYLIIRDRLGWNKKMHHLVSQNEALFLVKIPFVFEGIITIQYLHNQILDRKNGINSEKTIANNLLIANILKDNLYEYIESAFPENIQLKLTKTVRKAFKLVDIGQLIEKKHNTYQSFIQREHFEEFHFAATMDPCIDFAGLEDFMDQLKSDLPRTHWEFTELYLKRIYLTCAALFTLNTSFLCDTLGIHQEEQNKLMKFATAYGMMRQLINDNADWVPASYKLSTLSKLPEDALSDLKNRNITLPMIFHLAESPRSIIAQWLAGSQKNLTARQEQEFALAIMSDHSIFKSIQLSRLLATIANTFLEGEGEAEALLADTSQIAWWNKFLAPVIKTEAYKAYRKTGNYKRLKKLIARQTTLPTLSPIDVAIENEKKRVPWPLKLSLK